MTLAATSYKTEGTFPKLSMMKYKFKINLLEKRLIFHYSFCRKNIIDYFHRNRSKRIIGKCDYVHSLTSPKNV